MAKNRNLQSETAQQLPAQTIIEVATPAAPAAPEPMSPAEGAKFKTKKEVVAHHLLRPQGGTIEEMAEACKAAGLDPDVAKSERTCRLWLSKMGAGWVIKREGKTYKGVFTSPNSEDYII